MSSLRFTLIQTHLFWEDKAANLQMLEQKLRQLPEDTHVVILPEMFSTGFSMQPELLAETMEDTTISWMKNLAAELKVILTGSIMVREEGDGGAKYFNRLLWVLPNGQLGYYDKRHLFAVGDEDKHYTPGDKRFIASVNGWKINLQICYDLRFPVWARQSNPDTPEYDVLIYIANWPERRAHAWKTLLAARAIENQCYVIGVNRVGEDGKGIYHSGESMIVNPLGEVLYHKAHEEDIFTIELHQHELQQIRQTLPFLRDGDHFQLLS